VEKWSWSSVLFNFLHMWRNIINAPENGKRVESFRCFFTCLYIILPYCSAFVDIYI
jgi:hypothetical protein